MCVYARALTHSRTCAHIRTPPSLLRLQFIDGSALIRAKTENEIQAMTGDISTLITKMDAVNRLGNATEDKLGKGRERVVTLANAKPIMKKLLAVLDLPKRIHAALENAQGGWETFEHLVEDIRHAWPVLARLREHNEKIAAVHASVSRSLVSLRERLERELTAMSKETPTNMEEGAMPAARIYLPIYAADAAEIARLVAMLPGCDSTALLKSFVDSRANAVDAMLADARRVLDDSTMPDAPPETRIDPNDFIETMSASVLGEIAQSHIAVTDIASLCASMHGADAGIAEKRFSDRVGAAYDEYMLIVRECVRRAGLTIEAFEFVACLQSFASAVSSTIVEICRSQPLSEMGCRLCEQLAMDRVNAEGAVLRTTINDAIQSLLSDFSICGRGDRLEVCRVGPPTMTAPGAYNPDAEDVLGNANASNPEDGAADRFLVLDAHASLLTVHQLIYARMQKAIDDMGTLLRGRPVWTKSGPERALSWKNIVVHTAMEAFTDAISSCCSVATSSTRIDDDDKSGGDDADTSGDVDADDSGLSSSQADSDSERRIVIGGQFAAMVLFVTCLSSSAPDGAANSPKRKVTELIERAFDRTGGLARVSDADVLAIESFELHENGWDAQEADLALDDAAAELRVMFEDEVCRACTWALSGTDTDADPRAYMRAGISAVADTVEFVYTYVTCMTGGDFDVDLLGRQVAATKAEAIATAMLSNEGVKTALEMLAGTNVKLHRLEDQLESAMAGTGFAEKKEDVWVASPMSPRSKSRSPTFTEFTREEVIFGIVRKIFKEEILANLDGSELSRTQCELTFLLCRFTSLDGVPAQQFVAMAEEVFVRAIEEGQTHGDAIPSDVLTASQVSERIRPALAE